MSVFGGPDIITDGLVLHLDAANRKSYPGSGSTWYNLANSAYNATYIGSAYSSTPPASFYYNGAHYTYINDQSFIVDTSFSISLWIKTTDSSRAGGSVGSQGRVVASTHDHNGNGTDKHTGWTMGTIWQGTYFDFRLYDGSGSSGYAVASSTETNWYATYLNQWTYVAGVFKSGDYIKLYQNGQLINQQSTAVTTLSAHNDPIYIGRRSAEGQSHWLGNIATFSYYNRWLRDDEVLNDYNALKGRFGL